MTTMANQSYACSVCGGATSFPTVMSTNAQGSVDLDLRPPEMQRSTMSTWVQTCPFCGFAAPAIDRPTGVTRAWLSFPEYAGLTEVTGDAPKASLPPLAREFFLAHKCHLADGMIDQAIDNLICGAWDCDDAGEGAAGFARNFRLLAADLMEQMLEELGKPGEGESPEDEQKRQQVVLGIRLRSTDLLRRARDFDRAAAQCSAAKRLLGAADYDRTLMLVAAYEQHLIDAGDTACHTVREAIEAEATLKDILHEIRRAIRS